MIPDRKITKMVKRYDPNLFIKWNHQHDFFELWMKHWQGGAVKITPITQSIYHNDRSRQYVDLDERLLAWIFHADSARPTDFDYLSIMRAKKAYEKSRTLSQRDNMKNFAKDMWHINNNIFATRERATKVIPKFNNYEKTRFIRPTQQSALSNRVFSRGAKGARSYNYRGVN